MEDEKSKQQERDRGEEDPDGRMADLLPPPDGDFDDEAVATETEDDYSDEADAEVDSTEKPSLRR